MTTIYDRSGKNTIGIADGPVCGSGDDDPRQGFAKPVASMTDDAAMLIKQPGDDVPLDNLEKIVGPNPERALRASFKVRAAVVAQLADNYVGITVEAHETSTGSPMATVTLPDGERVNITFTVARR